MTLDPRVPIFGANVRWLRKQRRWTLRYMSEQVGCVFSNLARIERGEGNLTLSTALQIADVLDTTLDVLTETRR